jgi:hypothetical protein
MESGSFRVRTLSLAVPVFPSECFLELDLVPTADLGDALAFGIVRRRGHEKRQFPLCAKRFRVFDWNGAGQVRFICQNVDDTVGRAALAQRGELRVQVLIATTFEISKTMAAAIPLWEYIGIRVH